MLLSHTFFCSHSLLCVNYFLQTYCTLELIVVIIRVYKVNTQLQFERIMKRVVKCICWHNSGIGGIKIVNVVASKYKMDDRSSIFKVVAGKSA